MLTSTFEHDQLKKYAIVFGALFNDISIHRDDSGDDAIQKLKVPLMYGPKDKALARVNQNPTGLHHDRPAITLPRMSFELGGMTYDPTRKMQSAQRLSAVLPGNDNAKAAVYSPVPYNIEFRLWIMVKNSIDGQRIIEQILPYFTPQYTITAEIIPALSLSHDIPVILNSVQMQDDYEGSYEERRSIVWTLDFILKGFFYGPVTNTGLIKLAEANIFNALDSNTHIATVSVQPGLTANGLPTTDISETVAYTLINESDDWAYIVQIDEEM